MTNKKKATTTEIEASQPKSAINTVPTVKAEGPSANPKIEFIPEGVLKLINQDNSTDVELTYTLLEYVEKMSGKRQSDDTIIEMQTKLFNTLKAAFDSSREDYARRQLMILKVISDDLTAKTSAFAGTKPYRIDKVINLFNTKSLTIWLTFLRQTAPIKTRARNLTVTNLKEVAATITRPESRNAFLAFYGAQMQY